VIWNFARIKQGWISFEIQPHVFRFIRTPGFGTGSQPYDSLGSQGLFELSSSFPHLPCVRLIVRVSSLPIVRFVSDSRNGHRLLSPSGRFLFRLQHWTHMSRIELPEISIFRPQFPASISAFFRAVSAGFMHQLLGSGEKQTRSVSSTQLLADSVPFSLKNASTSPMSAVIR
jgi:hypothetical protein